MDVQTLGEDDDEDDDERNPQRNQPRNHNPHDIGYNAEDIVEDEEEYIDFEDIANHEHPDIILEADIGSFSNYSSPALSNSHSISITNSNQVPNTPLPSSSLPNPSQSTAFPANSTSIYGSSTSNSGSFSNTSRMNTISRSANPAISSLSISNTNQRPSNSRSRQSQLPSISSNPNQRSMPSGSSISSTTNRSANPQPPKKRPSTAQPVTTLRTGLTEDQLRGISSTIRERGPAPGASETVAKRRKIDNLLDRGNDMLSASDSGGDSMLQMMLFQSNERNMRADEWRREDREREDRKDERRVKDEQDRIDREEKREERREREEAAKLEREELRNERREKEQRDREDRREQMYHASKSNSN